MKSLFVAALAAAALTSAAPAMAQQFAPAGGPVQPGHGFREQLGALESRVQDGIRAGQIDPAEASRANNELASIRGEMETLRARSGGELSDMDRGRLQQRLDGLSRSIHWMRMLAGQITSTRSACISLASAMACIVLPRPGWSPIRVCARPQA